MFQSTIVREVGEGRGGWEETVSVDLAVVVVSAAKQRVSLLAEQHSMFVSKSSDHSWLYFCPLFSMGTTAGSCQVKSVAEVINPCTPCTARTYMSLSLKHATTEARFGPARNSSWHTGIPSRQMAVRADGLAGRATVSFKRPSSRELRSEY